MGREFEFRGLGYEMKCRINEEGDHGDVDISLHAPVALYFNFADENSFTIGDIRDKTFPALGFLNGSDKAMIVTSEYELVDGHTLTHDDEGGMPALLVPASRGKIDVCASSEEVRVGVRKAVFEVEFLDPDKTSSSWTINVVVPHKPN